MLTTQRVRVKDWNEERNRIGWQGLRKSDTSLSIHFYVAMIVNINSTVSQTLKNFKENKGEQKGQSGIKITNELNCITNE